MERWQRVAFRRDGAGYRLADAVLCAALAGEWKVLEAGILAGIACALRSEEEGSPLEDGELAEALRAFRYDHNLIAAEEAQEWLDGWELTAEDWSAALERQLLRRRWQAELAQVVEDAGEQYERDDEGLAEIAWADLVCSGALEALVRRLAERVAVVAEAETPPPVAVAATPATLPPWLGISADENDPAVRRLAGIIAVAEERRRQELSPQRLRAAIAARPLDWTYVEAVRLVLPTEAMAAEAALRVREDGETLAEVGREVGAAVERWAGFLETAEAGLRTRLVSASEGELLGPMREPAGLALLQVARRAPTEGDPVVRAHAERYVWNQAASRALEAIEWELPQPRSVSG
jgi:hypothetical protein